MYPHIKQEMTEHLAGMMSLSQPINDNMSAEQKEFKWFKLAAEQGNAIAQLNLGRCYRDGIGVVKNEKEEFKWFKLAAEQGNAIAQLNLGCCYRDGIGVAKNKEKAFKWFKLAAVQGNAEAQNNLGYCYEGGIGVPKIMLKQSSGTR